MASTAPPTAPGEASTAELLVELGQLRAKVEDYEDRDRKEAQAKAARAEALAANDIRRQPLVKIRFTRNTQGKTFMGDRVYRPFKGPVRDRSTNRVLKYGETAELPAEDARVFCEADFAEVLDGEHLIRWSNPIPVESVVSPAPHPDDDKGWTDREVR